MVSFQYQRARSPVDSSLLEGNVLSTLGISYSSSYFVQCRLAASTVSSAAASVGPRPSRRLIGQTPPPAACHVHASSLPPILRAPRSLCETHGHAADRSMRRIGEGLARLVYCRCLATGSGFLQYSSHLLIARRCSTPMPFGLHFKRRGIKSAGLFS